MPFTVRLLKFQQRMSAEKAFVLLRGLCRSAGRSGRPASRRRLSRALVSAFRIRVRTAERTAPLMQSDARPIR